MHTIKRSNLLIVHGGGPTAVINASLYGAIKEAQKYGEIESVYGAIGGVDGILEGNFINFNEQAKEKIDLLPYTPASAIGTSRKKLYEQDYENIIEILLKNNVKYLLFNGGNGSMDTCGKIYRHAEKYGINVIGVPKTIDNDIAVTDHSPGFGSAARYMAVSSAEVSLDVRAMPIHVCIIEAFGRNTGWLAAASALARKREGDGPHLIYVPERPFNQDKFLEDVEKLHGKLGGVVVVASEGLRDERGDPVVHPIFTRGRDVYFGETGAYLAMLVVRELGIKARSEKPGIISRASIALQSSIDREEAIIAGKDAVRAAVEGETGKMVGFRRLSDEPYKCETTLIPIEEVMMHEKKMPESFINERGNDVTPKFIQYCRGLIGGPLPEFTKF